MLTMGAMMLVSLSSLRFNSIMLQNSTIETENKVYLTAFSLADDMIEEIKNKSFDEATLLYPTTATAVLTKSDSLGHEPGEVYSNFDDIDDYNNYSKLISAPHAEDYTVSCKVFYVDANNQDNKITTQSFYKKVTVTVSSPFLRNSVNLSYVFTLK
jgi:hypothetical protein